MKKIIALYVKSIANLKTLKFHTFIIKQYFFLVFLKCGSDDEKICEKKNDSNGILKLLSLINNMQEYQIKKENISQPRIEIEK